MGEFLTVPPTEWPQDTLRPPGVSRSGMPPTSRANREFVRREGAILTLPLGQFTNLGGEGAGGQVQATIPTDQDGDFWCEQIFLSAYRNNATTFYGGPVGTLQFQDIRTGQSLMFGGAGAAGPNKGLGPNLNFFILGAVAANPLISGVLFFHGQHFPPRGQLPQPFVFTRQGGILVTYTSISPDLGAAFRFRLNLVFSGWKEYAYGQ